MYPSKLSIDLFDVIFLKILYLNVCKNVLDNNPINAQCIFFEERHLVLRLMLKAIPKTMLASILAFPKIREFEHPTNCMFNDEYVTSSTLVS